MRSLLVTLPFTILFMTSCGTSSKMGDTANASNSATGIASENETAAGSNTTNKTSDTQPYVKGADGDRGAHSETYVVPANQSQPNAPNKQRPTAKE